MARDRKAGTKKSPRSGASPRKTAQPAARKKPERRSSTPRKKSAAPSAPAASDTARLEALSDRLDTLCGWLSHIDARLRNLEDNLEDALRNRLLETEARLASWTETLVHDRREGAVEARELRGLAVELRGVLERWERLAAALEGELGARPVVDAAAPS